MKRLATLMTGLLLAHVAIAQPAALSSSALSGTGSLGLHLNQPALSGVTSGIVLEVLDDTLQLLPLHELPMGELTEALLPDSLEAPNLPGLTPANIASTGQAGHHTLDNVRQSRRILPIQAIQPITHATRP